MNIIKELRKENGLSQTELASRLHVTQASVSQWETGRTFPDTKQAIEIAEYFEVSVDYLLTGEDSNAFDGNTPPRSTGGKWIPVLGRVQAGVPVEAIEDILDWEEIPKEMARQGEFFALEIRGESMEPKFSDRDVVIVQRQQHADSGDIVVVLVNGEDATVKKLKKDPKGIMLIPTNPAFEPIYYSKQEIESLPVIVLGKVVELRAKF